MSKLAVVFGATGNQGGSVVDAILRDPELSKEFKIRGISRDITKPAAKALEARGVEMKTADLDSPESLNVAISGAHTVFLVTNYWESMDGEKEYNQGKTVADAAKQANTSHLIFSSIISATDASSGALKNLSHFDFKAKVEKAEDGSYTLKLPVTDTSQFPLFDISDIGKYVVTAMKHRDSLLGKQLLAAADYYSPSRIVEEFEQVSGCKAKFIPISAQEYTRQVPPNMAQELLENHLLLESPGYYAGASLDESLEIVEQKPTTWKEYVGKKEWK